SSTDTTCFLLSSVLVEISLKIALLVYFALIAVTFLAGAAFLAITFELDFFATVFFADAFFAAIVDSFLYIYSLYKLIKFIVIKVGCIERILNAKHIQTLVLPFIRDCI
ncbi:MAG: hypothetical protein ACI9VI_002124, partial [Candidatus Azotimanducaceae bacterium]